MMKSTKELANKFGGVAISLAEFDDFNPEDGMILENATSIEIKPKIDVTPIYKSALSSYSFFYAINTPKWTRLLQEALESGANVVFGTKIFNNQPFVYFGRFTGFPAPKALIRGTLTRGT